MAIEIERKFLTASDGWKNLAAGMLYRQGYLSTGKERTVRIRTAGDRGFITVKGISIDIARAEFEYGIPFADANDMLDSLCLKPLIEKRRYRIEHRGRVWEVDEFFGENLGLVVAEVELSEVGQQVDLPAWIGREISDDPRYFNSSLVAHPYSTW